MEVAAQRGACCETQGDSRTCGGQICPTPLGSATALGPLVTKQENQLSNDRQPSQRGQQAGKASQVSQARQAHSSKSVMADQLSKPELVTGRIATLQGKSFESFLHLHPEQKVSFPSVVAGASASRTLSMKNVSSDYVAFKIKTTSPQSFLAHPGHGIIGPSQQKDICLTLRNENAGGSANPRYMIQLASVSDAKPLSLDAWKKLSKDEVLERQLQVATADQGTLLLPEPAAGELCFSSETGEAGALVSTLMLTNLSGTHVAFKMKANNHCAMTPSRGTLGPDQQVQIHCRLEDKSHWERVPAFLMQAVAVGTATPLDNKEWVSFRRESIQEWRWNAVLKKTA